MRATNLRLKNPHEIYHAAFQIPTVDYLGRKISSCRQTNNLQRPREILADRFNNQYTKNYSTNSNLSPNKYNPQYGTIAGDLKHKRCVKYVSSNPKNLLLQYNYLQVEDLIGSRASHYYTFVGDMKIFNPEIISPKHQRILTPMHSKSMSIDLTTGFNSKAAKFINTTMQTLEDKMDYELEAIKAMTVKPLRSQKVSISQANEFIMVRENGNETPSTMLSTSPLRTGSPTANQSGSPDSYSPLLPSSPNSIYETRRITRSARSKQHCLDSSSWFSQDTAPFTSSISTKNSKLNQSLRDSILEVTDHEKSPTIAQAKSPVNSKSGGTKTIKKEIANRFLSPKDKVNVVSVNLKYPSKAKKPKQQLK